MYNGFYHYGKTQGSMDGGYYYTCSESVSFDVTNLSKVQEVFNIFLMNILDTDSDISYTLDIRDGHLSALYTGTISYGNVCVWCTTDGEAIYSFFYLNSAVDSEELLREFTYLYQTISYIDNKENNANSESMDPTVSYGASEDSATSNYLINKHGIKLSISDEAEIWGSSNVYMKLHLVFENDSGNEVGIIVDSIAVNGWEVYADSITPIVSGRKKKAPIDIKISDANVSSISEIESIVVSFRVYDGSTYKTVFNVENVSIPLNLIK